MYCSRMVVTLLMLWSTTVNYRILAGVLACPRGSQCTWFLNELHTGACCLFTSLMDVILIASIKHCCSFILVCHIIVLEHPSAWLSQDVHVVVSEVLTHMMSSWHHKGVAFNGAFVKDYPLITSLPRALLALAPVWFPTMFVLLLMLTNISI